MNQPLLMINEFHSCGGTPTYCIRCGNTAHLGPCTTAPSGGMANQTSGNPMSALETNPALQIPMTDKQVIERLRAALLTIVPSHRVGCWCGIGRNINGFGHEPGCIQARAALADVPQAPAEDQAHCQWCNSELAPVFPKCDPSSQVEPMETRTEWRVGRKIPLNVYDGDRPVCQCHNEEDARRIVAAVSATPWKRAEPKS